MIIKRSILALIVLASLGQSHRELAAHGTPRGILEIDWAPEHVARTISAGYPDSLGLYALPRRGLPTVETIDGRRCISGSFFAFDVEDAFAFDVDERVELELVFDRTRTTAVQYAYDRNGVAEAIAEIVIEPNANTRWHRETLVLERARFANRGMAGTDIALVAGGALWPAAEDESNTLTLCDLRLKRTGTTPEAPATGELDLEIVDSGARTSARVGLYDTTGRTPLPGPEALVIESYSEEVRQLALRSSYGPPQRWPSENRYVFYVDGRYRAWIPAGRYRLVVAKGPEYRVVERTLTIESGGKTSTRVEISRWDTMPKKRWYSGDAHVHIGRDEEENAAILAFMRAEDVHVTNVLQMHNPAESYFHQYAFGPEGHHRGGAHMLIPGIEGPRTAQRGHTISLNIKELDHVRDQYFLYHRFFEEYARQGGLSGYAHVGSGEFNASWGLALDVPFGIVDFVEILQDGTLRTELWYAFLNLGFRLTPIAGSDFPYFDQPGAVRSYARVPGALTSGAWFAAVDAGHTFVTNGPMLELEVDGAPMGSTLTIDAGERLEIEASARINPDIDRLDRLELVIHGEVVATIRSRGGVSAGLTHELAPSDGLWLAVRAYGADQAVSHSAPIYVRVGGGGTESSTKAPFIAREMLARLDALERTAIRPVRELEFWDVSEELAALYREQLPQLAARIASARQRYKALLE